MPTFIRSLLFTVHPHDSTCTCPDQSRSIGRDTIRVCSSTYSMRTAAMGRPGEKECHDLCKLIHTERRAAQEYGSDSRNQSRFMSPGEDSETPSVVAFSPMNRSVTQSTPPKLDIADALLCTIRRRSPLNQAHGASSTSSARIGTDSSEWIQWALSRGIAVELNLFLDAV